MSNAKHRKRKKVADAPVRSIVETLAKEVSDSVGNHAISLRKRDKRIQSKAPGHVRQWRAEGTYLHLSETKTSIAGPTLDGLTGEDLDGSAGAGMDLVGNHVLETLVVRRAEVDLGSELAARVTVVHDLEAGLSRYKSVVSGTAGHWRKPNAPSRLVALGSEPRRDSLDRQVGEGRGITLGSEKRCELREQTLDQMTDRHSRRDGVRVDDDVRGDALARERHILLPIRDTDRTLLTVSGRKFVANLRDSR